MSDNTAVANRKKTVLLGGAALEVVEPVQISPVSVDLITEFRVMNGIIAISFATYVVDGNGQPEARICARLRIPMPVMIDVQQAVSNSIAAAEEAKKSAN